MKTVPVLIVMGLFALSTSSSAGDTTPKAYGQSVRKALDRAQSRLEGETDFYVNHTSWETPWEARTDHYLVRTICGYRPARWSADLLEEMYGFLVSFFGVDPKPQSLLQVDIHRDLDAYNNLGTNETDDNVARHTSSFGSFVSLATGTPTVVTYLHNDFTLLEWVTHGAVHQFLQVAFPAATLPTWMEEGLASYFAHSWPSSYDYYTSRYRQTVNSHRFLPLGQLIPARVDRYDERWFMHIGLMMRYLLDHREGTCVVLDPDTGDVIDAPFRNMIRRYLSGADVRSDPTYQLVTVRWREFEDDFQNFEFPQR